MKVDKGRRASIARSYLRPVQHRKNLTALPHTRVLKVLVERARANGVEVNGKVGHQTLHAARETILCLGAFASPQLLMLSGIGPAEHLQEYDFTVVADVPGVGSTLYDHLNLPFQCGLKDPSLSFARLKRLDRAVWMSLRYLMFPNGPGTAPFWSTAAFDAFEGEVPEFQVFMTSMLIHEDPVNKQSKPEYFLDVSSLGSRFIARGKQATSSFSLDINLMQPENGGTVRLALQPTRKIIHH